MKKISLVLLLIIFSGVAYCKGSTDEFHKSVDYVDMDKFSGDWYVIALIPTFFEKDASYGIENYSFDNEGNIRVKYTYQKGGKDKIMYQKGWIYNTITNSEWRVQPLWPLKLPYYILELNKEYTYTVIGTNSYDYLWIMAKTSSIEQSKLDGIINRMVDKGFDRDKIVYMPQHEVSYE